MLKDQAFQKLKHYCAYQERCHREVENKLFELKVSRQDHAQLLADLIEGGFLNEERFALQYAGGKFRMKQWGRRKIIQALQAKSVSEYCIKKAMKGISNDDYALTVAKLVKKKMATLTGDTFQMKKKKTLDYMMGKGFEPALVIPAINELQPVKKARLSSRRKT